MNADGTVIVGWQDQLTGERGRAIVGTNYAWSGHQAWIWREGDHSARGAYRHFMPGLAATIGARMASRLR